MATLSVQAVQFNQIPKDSAIYEDIKPLGKDDTITFRLKGSYDPSNPKKRTLRTLMLPQTDVIKDPKTGDTYDIGYIESVRQGGLPVFGEIWFDDKSGSAIKLHGKRAEDVRKYNYIMISNYLADNKNSDPKKHLIEIESEDKDMAFVRNKRKKVQAALNTVAAMNDSEILNFMRANRLPDPGTPGKRRFKLEDFAERNPDAFASAPMLDYTSLYDFIDELKQKKIVSFNNTTRGVVRCDGFEVLAVSKKIGVSWKEELAKFLIRPENKRELEWLKNEAAK